MEVIFQKSFQKWLSPISKLSCVGRKAHETAFHEGGISMNAIPMDARTEAIQDTLVAISVVSRQLASKIETLKNKAKEAENREQHE